MIADKQGLSGHRVQLARRVCAALIVAISVSVLLGWMFHLAALKTVFPGMTSMKANTAVGLAAAAAAIALMGARFPGARAIAVAAAALIGLLGLLTLIEYSTGVKLGLDELLFRDPDTTSRPFNGRMSPATAMGFVAAGLSLGLLRLGRSSRSVLAAHFLAAAPATIGFLSLAGYAYGVERLYNFGPFVSVALHTGVALALLAAAILLTRPDEGWARPFIDKPIAMAALLRIGLLALLVPFATGLLVVLGIRAGFYQAQFTPALFAVAAAAALLWLAFRSAGILSQAEGEVRRAHLAVRQRDEQLERSETRHLALVEELPQLVWTCLPDGRCDYLSRQWTDYTGLPEESQLGFDWLSKVIHPDDEERTRTHWMGAVAGDHGYDIDYRIRRADGVYRWFKTRGTPIREADGRISYWFGTCTDIQDIVEARDVLARSRRELELQVEARTAEVVEIESQLRQVQKMEAVGQLTGGIAHDFNNLLMGVSGSLDMLKACLKQGRLNDMSRYIDSAQGEAKRAAALTQRLLAFSRRQTLDPKPIDVNRLVDGMGDLIRRTVGLDVTVSFAGAPALWPTLVDPNQLENALLNLCINARDAMPDGGQVSIETGNQSLDAKACEALELPGGDYVTLTVGDTGVGMAPEIMARAFDPFFTTKPLGQGTGLGLSMIYGFVRQSGGQVRIESEVGRGTRMRLYLPRYFGEMAAPRVDSVVPASYDGVKGETVLVIDDEPIVRMLVVDALTNAGYHTLEASDGAAGLTILRTGARIDLLVTDVGLPGGMNGRQVADAARSVRPALKVLFITGYAGNAAVGNGRLGPGMEVVTKPFEIDVLGNKIREMIDR